MKYKYFLRGFGFGILFATLILMFALAIKENMPQNNNTKKDVLSSEGKETENKSEDNNEDENDNKDNIEDNSDKNNETSSKDEISSEEASDGGKENTTEDSEMSKSEEITSEEEMTSKEEETTTKEQESISEVVVDIPEETTSVEIVVFTLSGGMSSNQVAQALKDLGVVESATEFNDYMENNGIAKTLRIGVYQIPKNASYSEIADILVKRN